MKGSMEKVDIYLMKQFTIGSWKSASKTLEERLKSLCSYTYLLKLSLTFEENPV